MEREYELMKENSDKIHRRFLDSEKQRTRLIETYEELNKLQVKAKEENDSNKNEIEKSSMKCLKLESNIEEQNTIIDNLSQELGAKEEENEQIIQANQQFEISASQLTSQNDSLIE